MSADEWDDSDWQPRQKPRQNPRQTYKNYVISILPKTNKMKDEWDDSDWQPRQKQRQKPRPKARQTYKNDAIYILPKSNKMKETRILSRIIVYGYIRQIQNMAHQSIMPQDVINIILMNYTYTYPDKASFNNTKYGKQLKFINSRTVTKISNNGYGTCSFGTPIGKGICKQYTIKIQIHSMLKGFMMGFICSMESIDCDMPIGRKINRNYSLGLYVCMDDWYLEMYSKNTGNLGDELEHQYESVFDDESEFTLVFNFVSNRLIVYHDNEKGQVININDVDLLIPAFTLFDKNDSIEISKWTRW